MKREDRFDHLSYCFEKCDASNEQTPIQKLLNTLEHYHAAKKFLTPEGSKNMIESALAENHISIDTLFAELQNLQEELASLKPLVFEEESIPIIVDKFLMEKMESEYQGWKDVKIVEKNNPTSNIYVITAPLIKDNVGYYQLANLCNNNPPITVSVKENELWEKYEINKA